jgi:hypothetical protein
MNLKPMLFKRLVIAAIAVISISVVAISFSDNLTLSELPLPIVKNEPKSPLTGLSAENGPVIVVKIDDTSFAHPQVGLRDADVVYIEQVEGGLTRLAAVFSSKIPSVIGPVRSARITDLELFAQYGRIGFAYSGAQSKLLPEIAAANLVDIGANRYGAEFYKNDPLRKAPYAMMVSAPELLQEAKTRGADFVSAKPMGWKFGDESPLAEKIEKIEVSWPAGRYGATWSQAEERWLLTHNGVPDLDETGYQLGPENIVVQLVSITDSIYKDKVGGVTPFSETVGTGDCYLLRDGSSVPCRWTRSSAESGTSFTDINGEEIFFAPGGIWFALTSKEPLISALAVQDATKTMSK